MIFGLLHQNLRSQGVQCGLSEWLCFLKGLADGLVVSLDDLYGFGRTVLCTTEAQFDAYDLAFSASFKGVELTADLRDQFTDELMGWLKKNLETEGELVHPDISIDDLFKELQKRLQEQNEQHDGGSRWIGTGGTSPFGHSGRASHGIRVGGASKNRSAVAVAGDRSWENYRTDTRLETRDFQVALKALRRLAPEGEISLDIDGTIRKTCDNGGEIDLHFTRERINKVKLILLMDSGGSMEPHARMVSQLFTAASEMKGFKSFEAWHFHNVPYGWLFNDEYHNGRIHLNELMQEWTPKHRVIWVGDASMAPYELFTASWTGQQAGIEWLRRVRKCCPKSIWLNPDPVAYWDHPTVRAIGNIFPMHPLTIDGLRQAILNLIKSAELP